MNPFLKALIGQQMTPSLVATPEQEAESERLRRMYPNAPEFAQDNEILVTKDRPDVQNTADRYADYNLNNEDAVIGRAADVRKTEEASKRRGLFGVRGTLRDILGIVGDAFLVQSGNKPMYAPTRQQERISDAMAGFTVDPLGAAERAANYDPDVGRQLYNDYETNRIKKAQGQSLAQSRQATADNARFTRVGKARTILGGMLNTPGAVENGMISPRALEVAGRIAANAGVSLADLGVYDDMTADEVQQYAIGSIAADKQERLEDADANISIAGRNAASREKSANASMIRANRPPAGRQPRAKTDGERFDEFRAIPENKRTRDQQDFIDDYVGRNKGRGGTLRPSRPSTNGGLQIRPVRN